MKYKLFSGKPGAKPATLHVEAETPEKAVEALLSVSCCPYKILGPAIKEDWDGESVLRFPIQNGWQIFCVAVNAR